VAGGGTRRRLLAWLRGLLLVLRLADVLQRGCDGGCQHRILCIIPSSLCVFAEQQVVWRQEYMLCGGRWGGTCRSVHHAPRLHQRLLRWVLRWVPRGCCRWPLQAQAQQRQQQRQRGVVLLLPLAASSCRRWR
jgi:hypothetical protein